MFQVSTNIYFVSNHKIIDKKLIKLVYTKRQRLTIPFIIYAVNDKSYLLLLLFL